MSHWDLESDNENGSSQFDPSGVFQKFKWTLLITFVGAVISVFASVGTTGTFNPMTLLIGLIISIMIAFVTSRYEEIKYNSTIMQSTLKRLNEVVARLDHQICPIKIVPTKRPEMYSEANNTLRSLLNLHKDHDQTALGHLLVIQRTPSPIFHSDSQKDVPGYHEEEIFIDFLEKAIALTKRKRIKLVYAFSNTDSDFQAELKNLLRNDPATIERIKRFTSTFFGKDNPDEYWDFLRLYPMDKRSAHPLIVADNVISIWIKETDNDRVYVKVVDAQRAKDYFDTYWKLTSDVNSAKVQKLMSDLSVQSKSND